MVSNMKSTIVSSKQVEVNFLTATLAQLQPIIKNLTAQEARYLRRLNELDGKTAALPRDVLATIFEFACSSRNLLAVILGSVCSHWGGIVWSTPQLWTALSITLEVTHDQSAVSHCSFGILCLYFTNAQELPLFLEMLNPHLDRCNQRPFRGPGIPHEQLFELIFQDNPQKLRTFSYTMFTMEWWQSISKFSQPNLMINLEHLLIGWHHNTGIPTSNSHNATPPIPSLTGTSLIRGALIGQSTSLYFPYTQITILWLFSVRADDCLDLLLNTGPNLKEFHCFGLRPGFEPFSSDKYSCLTINTLETLDWQFENSVWTQFLLTYVDFPSLCTIYCRHNISRHNQSMWQLLDQFIQRQEHLTTFDAHNIPLLPRQRRLSLAGLFPFMAFEENDDTMHYPRGFFNLSNLEELNLTGLEAHELEFVFNELRIRRTISLEDQILPRLQVLRIDSGHGLKEGLFKFTVFSAFVKMLRSRRDSATYGWEEYTQLRHVRLKHLHSLEEERPSETGIDCWFDVLERLMDEGLEVELAL